MREVHALRSAQPQVEVARVGIGGNHGIARQALRGIAEVREQGWQSVGRGVRVTPGAVASRGVTEHCPAPLFGGTESIAAGSDLVELAVVWVETRIFADEGGDGLGQLRGDALVVPAVAEVREELRCPYGKPQTAHQFRGIAQFEFHHAEPGQAHLRLECVGATIGHQPALQ
jgi:hypothetical protein